MVLADLGVARGHKDVFWMSRVVRRKKFDEYSPLMLGDVEGISQRRRDLTRRG